LLIGNSNLRVTNLIQSLVRGVCGAEVSLHSTRTQGVDEFVAQAVRHDFDLIIMNPENLQPAWRGTREFISINQAADAIRSIKTLRSAPIIAVAVSPENDLLLSESGADLVLGLPFNCEDLKEAALRFLPTPVQEQTFEIVRPSIASAFARGWERLKESAILSKP
jgi:hypothetical protein